MLRQLKTYLTTPKLLHFVLPVLMAYLLAGTIAQKYIGLYAATEIFFSSPIIWLGPLPLPGVPVLIALIFINLAMKLIYKSPWQQLNTGNIITHIGAMLLLVGALLTALFSQEGYMDLAPNETRSFVTDYHKRVLRITDASDSVVFETDHENLQPGDTLTIAGAGLSVKILETCRNCEITKRPDASDSYQGMAQHMQLTSGPLQKQDEDNMAGLVFAVAGQAFLTLENVPQYPESHGHRFAVVRANRNLPFSVSLLDFQRETHPGTDLASAYQSHVRINDGPTQWESVIRMNEPLRYKGYTFYQSSFIETPDGDISVLSVVQNAGRSFPYISGITICVGLILHLFVRRKKHAA